MNQYLYPPATTVVADNANAFWHCGVLCEQLTLDGALERHLEPTFDDAFDDYVHNEAVCRHGERVGHTRTCRYCNECRGDATEERITRSLRRRIRVAREKQAELQNRHCVECGDPFPSTRVGRFCGWCYAARGGV